MFKINNREISTTNSPYIIAEISGNHGGSLDILKKTIEAAKAAGADAVKLQTYTPDSMTIDSEKKDFLIKDGLWKGNTLYNLYKKACTPYEWHHEAFKFAKKINIEIFSTPFDEHAVDFLLEFDVKAFKISSFEINDHNLIKKAASTNRPLLLSSGMASETEIREAVKVAMENGNGQVLLFHCISSYPADLKDAHLNKIKNLKKEFGIEVGLSDHTVGNMAGILSIPLGASAIEKHFILNKEIEGPDSEFSITKDDFSVFCNTVKQAWNALGKGDFSRPDSESENLKFRRSLYFVKSLKKGDIIKSSDIRKIRPGYGLSPKYFNKIVGEKVLVDVNYGDRVTLDNTSFNDL